VATYSRPASDISAGSWTTTPLYSKINETFYSESEYIQGPSKASSTCQLGLSSVTDPQCSDNHILRIRAYATSGITLTIELREGTGNTLRASWTPTLTTSYNTYTYTLTGSEADSIADYSALKAYLVQTYFSGTGTRRAYVACLEFQVPTPITANTDAYIKGGASVKDNKSAYTTGLIRSHQDGYLGGVVAEKDNQPVYLVGNELVTGDAPVYLCGEDFASEAVSGYTEGSSNTRVDVCQTGIYVEAEQSVLSVNQIGAYVETETATLVTSDTPAYTQATATDSSFSNAYLYGSSDVLDSGTAYTSGGVNTTDSALAFLSGSQNTLDNILGYLCGGEETSSSEYSYLTGQDIVSSFISAFICQGAESSESILAFTTGQDTASTSGEVYLAGSLSDKSSANGYIVGNESAKSSVSAWTGTAPESASSDAPAYITGSQLSSSTKAAYLTGCQTFITDFSEYTLEAQPSDWTEQWHTTSGSSTVKSGGDFGGKQLYVISSSQRYGLSWNNVGTPTDVEIVVRFKFNGTSGDLWRVLTRGSGTSTTETGWMVYASGISSVVLGYYNNATFYTVNTQSISMTTGKWYWIRFRTVGTSIKYKLWSGLASSEPGTWTYEATNSNINQAGWVAVGEYQAAGEYIDYFSAGLGVDAPIPDDANTHAHAYMEGKPSRSSGPAFIAGKAIGISHVDAWLRSGWDATGSQSGYLEGKPFIGHINAFLWGKASTLTLIHAWTRSGWDAKDSRSSYLEGIPSRSSKTAFTLGVTPTITVYDFCGFETGDEFLERDYTAWDKDVQSTVKRTGEYALVTNPTDGTRLGYWNFGSMSVATAYYRFYIRIDMFPETASEPICYFINSDNSYTSHVRVNSDHTLSFYDKNDTLKSTGTTTLELATWYRIEIGLGTGTAANYELRIDGATELSGTLNNGTYNNHTISLGKAINKNSQQILYYFDDLILSNWWVGEGGCVPLQADSDGDYIAWSGGGADRWDRVNEIPFSTADYVVSTLTVGDAYTANFKSMADVGRLGYGINAIKYIGGFLRDESANGLYATRIRSGTTNVDDPTDPTLGYSSPSSVVYKYYVKSLDPATSLPWTPAGVNAIQAGAVEGSTVNKTRMSSVVIMVDCRPGTSVKSNQSAYTELLSYDASDSLPAFMAGTGSEVSSVPAWTRSGWDTTTSQHAYMFSEPSYVHAYVEGYSTNPTDYHPAFTNGGGPWPFTDDFTGDNEDEWDSTKWLSVEVV